MENFKEIWPAVVWRETCTNSQIVVFAGINQKKPGLNYGTKYLMSGKETRFEIFSWFLAHVTYFSFKMPKD